MRAVGPQISPYLTSVFNNPYLSELFRARDLRNDTVKTTGKLGSYYSLEDLRTYSSETLVICHRRHVRQSCCELL